MIRQNRYSDPALGAAFENIASIFGPASPGDTANFALANARKQEADRLSWLFDNPNDPTASNRSALTGVQGFGQTPDGFIYSVDTTAETARRGQDIGAETSIANNATTNATTRRGQDIGAETSIANSATTNRASLIASLFEPLNPGQIRPEVPAGIADLFNLPGVDAEQGLDKPLTLSEQEAAERQGLIAGGQLTDQTILDNIIGAQPLEKIVGPDGPVLTTRGDAVGQEPFIAPTTPAARKNAVARLPDGTQIPVTQDAETGRWLNSQTGGEIPAGSEIVNIPTPTGSNEDLGIGKPTQSAIERQLVDLSVAQNTAEKLVKRINEAPASQGAVAFIRGTAQNLIQTGDELGQFFGGGVAEVNEAIRSGAADADLAGAFDPNIPAIEMMANLLAFQYAKTTTGERLSNEMLRASRQALGLDRLTANQADSVVRLQTAIGLMDDKRRILEDIRGGGLGDTGAETDLPPPPAGIDAENWPSLWEKLSDTEKALFR